MGDPRERTPAFIREALLASVDEVSSYPRATGLPELREAIAGWLDRRFGVSVDPERRDRADARLEGGDLLVRPDRARREAARRDPGARLSGLRARRAVRRRRGRRRAAARGPRLAARPRRVRRVGRDRALLGLLPEQPDRRGRAALVLRGAGGARARARLPALLRRGVLGALVRRAAGLGPPGRRPHERRRLQHAVEALVDDRLPLGIRVRSGRDRRRAARVSPDGRHRAPGVRPARVGRGLVGRRARRGRPRALPAQARDAAAGARGGRPAARRIDRDVLSLAGRRRLVGGVRAPAARARRRLRTRVVLRAGRRGLRPVRARADAGGVRARRRDRADSFDDDATR